MVELRHQTNQKNWNFQKFQRHLKPREQSSKNQICNKNMKWGTMPQKKTFAYIGHFSYRGKREVWGFLLFSLKVRGFSQFFSPKLGIGLPRAAGKALTRGRGWSCCAMEATLTFEEKRGKPLTKCPKNRLYMVNQNILKIPEKMKIEIFFFNFIRF